MKFLRWCRVHYEFEIGVNADIGKNRKSINPRRIVVIGNRSFIILAVILCFCGPEELHSQSQREVEYRLKAVYLLNFLQFIEWPPSAFESEQSPLFLGILGKDPFGKILDETVQAEKVGEHPIAVKRFWSWEEFDECHALFVCSSEKSNLKSVFNRLAESSVLTVSDIEGFEDLGGGISFFLDKNKIRFAINIHVMKLAGLKVSSKLLRLAKVVDPS